MMMDLFELMRHVYFVPSLVVSLFFVAGLVILEEEKDRLKTILWGGLVSLCPYMIASELVYQGLMQALAFAFGDVPLLLDVILDYSSRLILLPVAIFLVYKKMAVHWSLSLFLLSAFGGIGYLGMVVGKTQLGACAVDAVAIMIWWKLLKNELSYVGTSLTFRRYGFLGVFTSFSLLVNLAMYVCVRMIEVTPEFLNYLVFVSILFWLTLTIAVKLIFRAIRLEQEAELERNHDDLTGLPNALLSANYVQELLAHNGNRRFAFIVFDFDNFKSFNEKYGFEQGNVSLRFLAKALETRFGVRFVTRVSADVFRVVADLAGLNAKIKDVHDEIRAFSKAGELDVKAGIYLQRTPNQDLEEIEKNFMRARLAEASIKGIYDRYVAVYADEMGARERLKMYLVSHVDEAIRNEYIQVYYQPVVNAKTNTLCGFEALARWIDPEHGFLSPIDFISILEEAHLIHKLDLFMLEKVCENYRKESNQGHLCVPVSFNLSRLDFKLCDIFKEVEKLTQKYNVPHNMIHIEITESVLDGDDGQVLKQVKNFRKEGYEVWMDDFGSGFSSLNVLKDYEFDCIKIDMLFLRNFTQKSKVIIRSVVDMAKNLHLGTLTEGVETEEHLKFLEQIGCDRVQGYYFSKPLPYDEVKALLQEKGVISSF